MKYAFVVIVIVLFVFLYRLLGSLKGLNSSVETISKDTDQVSKGLEMSSLKMEYSKAVKDKVWNKNTRRAITALSLATLTLRNYFKEDKPNRSMLKSVTKTIRRCYFRILR
jgi:hypothetical protein